MELGNRINEEDSTFQWYIIVGEKYRSTIKNIDELILHLKKVKAKGFTHVNHDMIGLKFLTKKQLLITQIKQLKKELDAIR